MIKISVPNDDHVALRAMARALEEIAVARGAPLQTPEQEQTFFKQAFVEVDTTSQQVESLSFDGRDPDNFTLPEPPTTDSTGTPWDERIHSASKALNPDGTWRLRRKPKDMDEVEWLAYVEEVKNYNSCDEEDLERLYPNGFEFNYEEVSDKAEPSVTPEGDDFHTDAGVVTEQQVASFPPPPPVPVSNAVTVAAIEELESGKGEQVSVSEAAGAPSLTFPQVMAFLTERHGRITSAQVDQIIADMGLEKITDLNTKPEHTGPFIARVKALLGE